MRVLVFTKPGRTVLTVRHPEISADDPPGFTREDAEARAWAQLPPGAIAPAWVDQAQLPADRLFRDAWTADGAAVAPDPGKARAIAHVLRRADRAAKMAPLDAEIARAIPGTDLKAIEAERAAIRAANAGVQAAIDKAATPEDLRAALGLPDFVAPPAPPARRRREVVTAETLPASESPAIDAEAIIARRREKAVQEDAARPAALRRADEANARIARKRVSELANLIRRAAQDEVRRSGIIIPDGVDLDPKD